MDKRVYGLDVMRCIAIMTVVYAHAWFMLPIGFNIYTRLFALQIFDGVDIFFTLSGFLIGTILLKKIHANKGVKPLLYFWRDRWLRTLPAYFFILAVIFCLTVKTIGLRYFLPYLFFIQNLYTGSILFNESWSLSVEEWFYICTPILFFIIALSKNRKKLLLFAIIGVIILGNAERLYKVHHLHITSVVECFALREVLPARMDAIMYGVLGAYLSYYRNVFWLRNKNFLFYAGLLGFLALHFLAVLINNAFTVIHYFYFPFEGIFTMMMLPKALSVKVGKGWIAKLITHISKTSYSIYLVNSTLFAILVQPVLPKKLFIQLPVFLLWAFGASYILYATVEKAGLRIREKLRRRQEAKTSMNERRDTEDLVPA